MITQFTRRHARRYAPVYALLASAALAAQPARTAAAQQPDGAPRNEAAIRAGLAVRTHPDLEHWDLDRWRAPLLALYESRRFAPLWFAGRAPTRATLALLAELRGAANRGLRAEDYDSERIGVDLGRLAIRPDPAVTDLPRLDVAISIAAARLVADLHAGRVDPRRVGHDLDVPHAKLDVAAAVAALAGTSAVGAVLDDFEPSFRRYELLKAALPRYRTLAAQPTLNALPPLPARSVHPGEPWEGTTALRALLGALGDLRPATVQAGGAPASGAPEGTSLDEALVDALKRFQNRHGLAADGVLGRGTWRALTVPLTERVRQIERSMERARWLPPRLSTPPIIVNIPQFKLFAFRTTEDDEQTLLIMDVIVGRSFPKYATPVFAADMRHLVLSPYWDVPRSILREELLPKIRANPAWMMRNGYEMVAGPADASPVVPATEENVEALAAGRLRLRQRPGPDNSLGLAKFMFPNRHNVYLHGTPAQSLFTRSRRDFSHGCIRVADPVALAEHVLRDQPEWTRERIEAAMRAGRPTRIPVRTPLRVFVIYATALATEGGEVLFFEDIYGLDARLDRLLAARQD